MSHYDNCREGYCPKCGAAPGNIIRNVCNACGWTGSKQSPHDTSHKTVIETLVTNARVAAEQTYVFDNVEVRKTGRKATNTLRSGKVEEVVEITPVDSTTGGWKKWIREDILFKVEQ